MESWRVYHNVTYRSGTPTTVNYSIYTSRLNICSSLLFQLAAAIFCIYIFSKLLHLAVYKYGRTYLMVNMDN